MSPNVATVAVKCSVYSNEIGRPFLFKSLIIWTSSYLVANSATQKEAAPDHVSSQVPVLELAAAMIF